MRALLGLLALLVLISVAEAQPVVTPPPIALACAYNTSPPTLTSGTFGYVQCDSKGNILGGIAGAFTPGDLLAANSLGQVADSAVACATNGYCTLTPGLYLNRSSLSAGTGIANNGLFIAEQMTGSCSVACNYNTINVTSDNVSIGASNSGIIGAYLRVNANFGGVLATGNRAAIYSTLAQTATTGNVASGSAYTAGSFNVTANANDNGTGLTTTTAMGLFQAINPVVIANGAATNLGGVSAAEFDVGVKTGASVYGKVGIQITQLSFDAVQGVEDEAILINNQTGAVGWKAGIMIGSAFGTWPFTSTSTVFACYSTCGSIGSFIDMGNATITTNFLNAPGFSVNGSGAVTGLTYNKVTITTPAAAATLTIANNKTLAVNNSLTFAGTDSTTITFPAASDTMAGLATVQTFTAAQTWNIASTVTSATGANLDDINIQAATTTVTGNTGSPITKLNKVSLYRPTITDSSAVTITDAATLYIDNSPLAAGSVTITNPWALRVGTGATKLLATTIGGALTYGGVTLSNAVTGTGNMVLSASPTFSGTVTGPDGGTWTSTALTALNFTPTSSTCSSGNNYLYTPASNKVGICANGNTLSFNQVAGFGALLVNESTRVNGNAIFESNSASTNAVVSWSHVVTNSGNATQTVIYLGNSTSNTEASIILNGGGFSGGHGANALTVTSAGNFWITGGSTDGLEIDSSGNPFLPSLANATTAKTGAVCWNTGGGALTYDNTSTCLVSTERSKKDITPINDALSQVLAIRPINYRYKEGQPDWHIGFTAENVAAVNSHLVVNDDQGLPLKIRLQEMTALAFGAIQQMEERLAAVERRVH